MTFDPDLLRAFVQVVDCGGFTRAGERLHRTQSTVSQQIRRLEEAVGRPLLERRGRGVEPTEAGDLLLGFARRILALQDEAQATLVRREAAEIVRLGLPEDFSGRHLPGVLAEFMREHPAVRLDVRCDLSCNLVRDFDLGELDVALVKGEGPSASAAGNWREPLVWAGPASGDLLGASPLPLALFPQGCIFRRLALAALDGAGIPWRIAYCSPSQQAILAAVASGIAIAPLGGVALTPEVVPLGPDGPPPLSAVWFSLLLRPGRTPLRQRLGDIIGRTVAAAGLSTLPGLVAGRAVTSAHTVDRSPG